MKRPVRRFTRQRVGAGVIDTHVQTVPDLPGRLNKPAALLKVAQLGENNRRATAMASDLSFGFGGGSLSAAVHDHVRAGRR